MEIELIEACVGIHLGLLFVIAAAIITRLEGICDRLDKQNKLLDELTSLLKKISEHTTDHR